MLSNCENAEGGATKYMRNTNTETANNDPAPPAKKNFNGSCKPQHYFLSEIITEQILMYTEQ